MKCSYENCERPVSSSLMMWANNGGKMPRPQNSGTRGRCAEHGAWAKCTEHWYLEGCPYCSAVARAKREEEQRQERETAIQRRQEEEAELAKVPLAERARQASEEKRRQEAERAEVSVRALRADIVPQAVQLIQQRLGVVTDPDDWKLSAKDEQVTLGVDGVSVMVRRTLEVNYARPSAHSDSYCSDYFYRGWVYNPKSNQWQELTLANFGDASQANKVAGRATAETEEKKVEQKPQHSGYPALRDFWSMLLATINGDAEAVQTIWEGGDHLAMMSWAFGTVLDLLSRGGDDPEKFARFVIERSFKDEAAQSSKSETS